MLMTLLDMRVTSYCRTLTEVDREVSLKSKAKTNVLIFFLDILLDLQTFTLYIYNLNFFTCSSAS